MVIIKFNVDNKECEFVNETVNTRNGFAHTTTLFVNGGQYAQARASYLNRTWEDYTYQSVMYKCVNSEIENRREYLLLNFKNNNNIKRMTEKRQEEFENKIANDNRIVFLKMLKEKITKGEFAR